MKLRNRDIGHIESCVPEVRAAVATVPIRTVIHGLGEVQLSEHLTCVLAEKIMGWGIAPERFLMGKRQWIPRWRFQPLANLEDAFRLLEKAAASFTLTATADGDFTARVSLAGRTGSASGRSKATTITMAVARAIGLTVPDQVVGAKR